jgi:hypothetical protein
MKKPSSTERKKLQIYKQQLVLSQPLFEIALGGLLGDISIQTQDGGKSYRLKFQQSDTRHRDYLFHLHGLFHEWVLSPPHFHRTRAMWSFQTISHIEFKKLAELFILTDTGMPCKKHIKPDLVEKYLTPLSLAYWFMDDGGKSCYKKDYPRKGFVFNTQGFEKRDVEILCKGLQTKFALHCWYKPNKKGYVLVISAKSYDAMMDLLGDSIIQSMRHKLPSGFRVDDIV